MKILIIQTAFIGDVVLATPLIEVLKKKYPNASIDFLLRKGNENLFEEHPLLNKVLIFDKKNKYVNLFKLVHYIRNQSYDYVINVQRFFTTGLLTCLSKAKIKIGFQKNPFSFCFTHRYPHIISVPTNKPLRKETDNLSYLHEVERNLSLLQTLTELSFQKPKLYIFSKHIKKVPNDYQYICIAPTSTWFTKQFPLEKWCKLIELIPQNYKIHLLGSKQDIDFCKKIQTQADNSLNSSRIIISAGKLNFLESVAFIKNAKITFVNDSAALHFASSVNAPVVAIFCSTIPQFGFSPLSDYSVIMQTENELSCRPCGLHGKKECPKKHFSCSEISVTEILKQAKII